MVDFEVKPESVAEVTDYLEQVRQNILGGIVVGMQEAMESLAETAAAKFESLTATRTGDVLAAILNSPKVSETSEVVRGTVSADVGKQHFGIWFDYGTSHQAVDGKLYHFTDADGKSIFTHGHAAFQVAARPFMNPSLQEQKGQIMELISNRVAVALRG